MLKLGIKRPNSFQSRKKSRSHHNMNCSSRIIDKLAFFGRNSIAACTWVRNYQWSSYYPGYPQWWSMRILWGFLPRNVPCTWALSVMVLKILYRQHVKSMWCPGIFSSIYFPSLFSLVFEFAYCHTFAKISTLLAAQSLPIGEAYWSDTPYLVIIL